MRSILAVLLGLFAFAASPMLSQTSGGACTGLCLQQVSCPNGGTTSISGTIYAPNGVDPLPNVLVYVPNAAVAAFTPGTSCPIVGAPPSGSPLVGATTGPDGTFTINNVPVGQSIPLVAVTGRWRRQTTVDTTQAVCGNTPVPAGNIRMPRNQSEGDIPKFAVATGSADSVECVLRKVGLDDAEFTAPSGTGRINLYQGSGSPGAVAGTVAATPSQDSLMANLAQLEQYDVLMLPCQGDQYIQNAANLANFTSFANAGGRIYGSHYSYVWMYNNAPFNGVVNWSVNTGSPQNGPATVNTGFAQGATLSQWLQIVGASTTPGQINLNTIRHDLTGIVLPTQSWLTLNSTGGTMQFTVDTPIGGSNQCGKVLFNEYHVEDPAISSKGVAFPKECTSGAMTPQEKLLEFDLFDLTNDGGQPTLTPTSANFGSQALGFATAPQTFTWTNNSFFQSSVSSATTTGDFAVSQNTCSNVAAGASCQISVTFTPTVLGARTGVLTVNSSGATITASLTGTGIPGLTLSPSTLAFGNQDVGSSTSQSLTLTNTATGSIPVPSFTTTGNYAVATTCPNPIPAGASCPVVITFTPGATGSQAGTLTGMSGYNMLSASFIGNGVDFSVAVAPGSGTVIAGYSASTTATLTPIAGFNAPLSISCTTSASASTCTPSVNTVNGGSINSVTFRITTQSQYTVIGYGGSGGSWILAVLGSLGGVCLWFARRRLGRLPLTLAMLTVLAGASFLTGCSSKYPSQNNPFTAAGPNTYTVTVTDGFLTHSATYTLNVTAK